MDKEVKIGDKTFVVKELKYKDITSINSTDNAEVAKKLLLLATGISEEQYNELSIKEGIAIMKVVNEINGLNELEANFRQAPKS